MARISSCFHISLKKWPTFLIFIFETLSWLLALPSIRSTNRGKLTRQLKPKDGKHETAPNWVLGTLDVTRTGGRWFSNMPGAVDCCGVNLYRVEQKFGSEDDKWYFKCLLHVCLKVVSYPIICLYYLTKLTLYHYRTAHCAAMCVQPTFLASFLQSHPPSSSSTKSLLSLRAKYHLGSVKLMELMNRSQNAPSLILIYGQGQSNLHSRNLTDVSLLRS